MQHTIASRGNWFSQSSSPKLSALFCIVICKLLAFGLVPVLLTNVENGCSLKLNSSKMYSKLGNQIKLEMAVDGSTSIWNKKVFSWSRKMCKSCQLNLAYLSNSLRCSKCLFEAHNVLSKLMAYMKITWKIHQMKIKDPGF